MQKRLVIILATVGLAALGVAAALSDTTIAIQVKSHQAGPEKAAPASVSLTRPGRVRLAADREPDSLLITFADPASVPVPPCRGLTLEEAVACVKTTVVRVFSDEGAGAGVVFDGQGVVLTSYHVVGDDAAPVVKLPDGRMTVGDVVAKDEVMDVAVIRISEARLRPAVLGDSGKLRQGQEVLALGFPLEGEVTVTGGIVSATGHQLFTEGPRKEFRYLQTDAAINPGNSGGPLVTPDGQVVGIIAYKQADMGFVIPINLVTEHMPDLLTAAAR